MILGLYGLVNGILCTVENKDRDRFVEGSQDLILSEKS